MKLRTEGVPERMLQTNAAGRPQAASREEKTEILRTFEGFGYQIAYYLLQDALSARLATERTLLELYRHELFFELSARQQAAYVQKVASREALAQKRQMLLQAASS